jgi:ABC-2 type transport system ATP-binding protein
MPAPGPAVRLEHVRRSFRGTVALADLNLEVASGQVTVLLGPNGAGKTTALRVLTGALTAEGGSVRVLGLDPASDGDEIRRRTGVVSAKPALYDRLTGRDNLRYAAELWDLGPSAPIEAAAARFGIASALGERVGGYSTGMKTRLALARAVLHEPDLLLLDEPTSGLDPESSQAVLALVAEMADAGTAVVMCTHLLLEAEGLADHVVLIQDGCDVVSGPPADLVRRLFPVPEVLLDAVDPIALRRVLEGADGPRPDGVGALADAARGGLMVTLDDAGRVPGLVALLVAAGVRLTRVEPHRPTLEELYLAVRRAGGWAPGEALPEVHR